jgi:hypothetical protein
LKHLLGMYVQSKMTAKDFCIACHFAMLAGTPGVEWSAFALGPGASTDGAYQKKLDRVLPPPADLYSVSTPVLARNEALRDRRLIPTSLLHEAIASEIREDPTILGRVAAEDLPESYNSHPVVVRAVANGEPLPLPVALYVDGVRYSSNVAGTSNTVLGFWAYTLVTGKRHLLVCTRNQEFCRCGCRGWCTLHPLLSSIAWSVRQLALGIRPTLRHDCQDGMPEELLEGLAVQVGEELGFKAAVVWLKGDWA